METGAMCGKQIVSLIFCVLMQKSSQTDQSTEITKIKQIIDNGSAIEMVWISFFAKNALWLNHRSMKKRW